MTNYLKYIPSNVEIVISHNTYLEKIELAKQDEKERIIKLLGAWSCGLDDCPEWRVNSEKVIEFCNPRNSLIALIKGEK